MTSPARIVTRLASAESVRARSHGVVRSAETLNYRNLAPVIGGLFCPRIFGPSKDYQCHCGKYSGVELRGITCERCGVEVESTGVRRERMGHIELASAVVNPLLTASDGLPFLAAVLGMSDDTTWHLLNGEARLAVIESDARCASDQTGVCNDFDGGDQVVARLLERGVISDDEWSEVQAHASACGVIGLTGPDAIASLLRQSDIHATIRGLREDERESPAGSSARLAISGRLRRLEVLTEAGISPADLMITALPVLPAGLRPIVKSPHDRMLSSSVNDLYRRVILRSERLEQLRSMEAPTTLTDTATLLLQDAVGSLFMTGGDPQDWSEREVRRPLLQAVAEQADSLLTRSIDYSAVVDSAASDLLPAGECTIPENLARLLFAPHAVCHLTLAEGLTMPAARFKLRSSTAPIEAIQSVVCGLTIVVTCADGALPSPLGLRVTAVSGRLMEMSGVDAYVLGFGDSSGRVGVSIPLGPEAIMEAEVLLGVRESPQLPWAIRRSCAKYTHLLEVTQVSSDTKVFASIDQVLRAADCGVIMPTELAEVRVATADPGESIRRVRTTACRLAVCSRLELPASTLGADIVGFDSLIDALLRADSGRALKLPQVLAQIEGQYDLAPRLGEHHSPASSTSSFFVQAREARETVLAVSSLERLYERTIRDLHRWFSARVRGSHESEVEPRAARVIHELGMDMAAGLSALSRANDLANLRMAEEAARALACSLWREEADSVLEDCGIRLRPLTKAVLAPFGGTITVLPSLEGVALMLTSGYLDERTWYLESSAELQPHMATGVHVDAGSQLTRGYVDWDELASFGERDDVPALMAEHLVCVLASMRIARPEHHAANLAWLYAQWSRVGDRLDRESSRLVTEDELLAVRHSLSLDPTRSLAVRKAVPAPRDLSVGVFALGEDGASSALGALIGDRGVGATPPDVVRMACGALPTVGTGAALSKELRLTGQLDLHVPGVDLSALQEVDDSLGVDELVGLLAGFEMDDDFVTFDFSEDAGPTVDLEQPASAGSGKRLCEAAQSTNGQRCTHPAKTDSRYCGVHIRMEEADGLCRAFRADGTCCPNKAPRGRYCGVHKHFRGWLESNPEAPSDATQPTGLVGDAETGETCAP